MSPLVYRAKYTIFLFHFLAEHKQFQKVISTLERDVADLKKEIGERDSSIQDKEKRIYELKRKKQELEKYKFVLNFKITELKNQVKMQYLLQYPFNIEIFKNLSKR